MAILQQKVGISNLELKKLRSMRPGRPIDIQLATSTGVKRVKSEFIGMDGRKCLILKVPDEKKWGRLKEALFKDAQLVIRYILEDETGEIIAFKVKVLLVATTPGDYIFTTFPEAMQSHDLRSETRAKTQLPALLAYNQEQTPFNSTIVDISNHGCRVSINKQLLKEKPELKQSIRLQLVQKQEVVLLATLMSVKADEVNVYFGMKFETPESEVKQLLSDLMVLIPIGITS